MTLKKDLMFVLWVIGVILLMMGAMVVCFLFLVYAVLEPINAIIIVVPAGLVLVLVAKFLNKDGEY